jgi:hypothetical protein
LFYFLWAQLAVAAWLIMHDANQLDGTWEAHSACDEPSKLLVHSIVLITDRVDYDVALCVSNK